MAKGEITKQKIKGLGNRIIIKIDISINSGINKRG